MKQNQESKETLESLTQDLKKIIEAKPERPQIVKEIGAMKLRVKSVLGEIDFNDLNNDKLLETLWRLGKLDEFFNTRVKKADPKDQLILMNLGFQIKKKLENELSQLEIKSRSIFPRLIEMEVFREIPKKKN